MSSVPPPWPVSPSPSPGTPAASARLAGRLALGADGHESGAAIPKVATGIGGFDHVAATTGMHPDTIRRGREQANGS